jgi:hypothetical protein
MLRGLEPRLCSRVQLSHVTGRTPDRAREVTGGAAPESSRTARETGLTVVRAMSDSSLVGFSLCPRLRVRGKPGYSNLLECIGEMESRTGERPRPGHQVRLSHRT